MQRPLVIDLSHHQVIPQSLELAKLSGIAGVIHKATEGYSIVDSKAKARRSLAQSAGLLWGVYHFLRPGDMKDQVKFFLADRGIIDDETLLVCDFEVKRISLDQVVDFLERVEGATGQRPVLYAGHVLKELGGAKACPQLAGYRLWIAQYNNTGPTLPDGFSDWWLWQYSEHGSVAGISGDVDLNAYQGDAVALAKNWVIPTENVCRQSS